MKKNIILIGMPSCGKTVLSRRLSKILKMPVYDSDAVIEKKLHCKISQIFDTKGEAYFRQIEHETIVELSLLENSIISTGGGVILNEFNMEALQKNGYILFIDRPLSKLKTRDPKRPLSKDKETLKIMYEKRLPLYQKYADAIIQNDGKIEETMQLILQNIGGSIYDYNHN